MLPANYITAWREIAPWPDNSQIEQDLILSRLMVELFQDKLLQDNLAMRGGTAIHKLFMEPPFRYSEDLDFLLLDPGKRDGISKNRNRCEHYR